MLKRFVLPVITVILFTFSGCGYNTIQENEEAVFAAWGDVEASYQRRADLYRTWWRWLKGTRGTRKKH